MLQVDLINEFLSKKRIAVVGVSRKGDIPANEIYKNFKKTGYTVYPVNPNAAEIEGDTCYADIMSIPEKPEAVFLAGAPKVSQEVVEDCDKAQVPIVWMHRGIGKGSYSEEAEAYCKEHNIKVITNGCPFMFLKPVDRNTPMRFFLLLV